MSLRFCRAGGLPLSFSALLGSVFLVACGVPGPPLPPTPKIPQPPRDLVATQRGERVLLRWSLPTLNTDGSRIRGQRAEVFRWFTTQPAPSLDEFAAQAEPSHAIPESALDALRQDVAVEFADPLGPELLPAHAGLYAVYAVKAVNRKGQDAGFSNLAAVRVYPVPTPIAELSARVTERAIVLRWDAPTHTTSGSPLAALAGYRIYRSSGAGGEGFQLIATTATPSYDDADFRFGETYAYRVRTLAQYGDDVVESDASAVASLTPRDTFPPPAPVNLVAIATPGRIDLTWDASAAADLAGYFLYRSEQADKGYERVTPAAIVVQSFSDANVAAGKTYYYLVTAVDREGNESPFSAPAAAATPPAPSPMRQD